MPLALAAASALDRLPRGLARFIDSLSLLFCGLIIVAAWFYWGAALAGQPEAAVRAVARQFPGYTFNFDLVSFLIAATVCVLWMYAVARAHRNNRRAVVNWAAGITLIWVTANLLALPAINHVRSYRSTMQSIANALPPTRLCLQALQLGDAQRAMLDYYTGIRVVVLNGDDEPSCDWAITQGSHASGVTMRGDWTPVWEGARPGDNVELFRIYRLTNIPTAAP